MITQYTYDNKGRRYSGLTQYMVIFNENILILNLIVLNALKKEREKIDVILSNKEYKGVIIDEER